MSSLAILTKEERRAGRCERNKLLKNFEKEFMPKVGAYRELSDANLHKLLTSWKSLEDVYSSEFAFYGDLISFFHYQLANALCETDRRNAPAGDCYVLLPYDVKRRIARERESARRKSVPRMGNIYQFPKKAG